MFSSPDETLELNYSSWRLLRSVPVRVLLQALRELAPQVGFEPTTPVNSVTQVFGLAVLRAGSSDENLLIAGVRQRIVQRLFSVTRIAGPLSLL